MIKEFETFRSVYDLKPEELLELKCEIFDRCYETGYFDSEQMEDLNRASSPEEVPDELVFYAFSGYEFKEHWNDGKFF